MNWRVWQYRIESWLFEDDFAKGYLWARSLLSYATPQELLDTFNTIADSKFDQGFWLRISEDPRSKALDKPALIAQ